MVHINTDSTVSFKKYSHPKQALKHSENYKPGSELSNNMLLIIDDVGIRMKSTDKIQILIKPAATHNLIATLV